MLRIGSWCVSSVGGGGTGCSAQPIEGPVAGERRGRFQIGARTGVGWLEHIRDFRMWSSGVGCSAYDSFTEDRCSGQ